jgi:hypothetical protein
VRRSGVTDVMVVVARVVQGAALGTVAGIGVAMLLTAWVVLGGIVGAVLGGAAAPFLGHAVDRDDAPHR